LIDTAIDIIINQQIIVTLLNVGKQNKQTNKPTNQRTNTRANKQTNKQTNKQKKTATRKKEMEEFKKERNHQTNEINNC